MRYCCTFILLLLFFSGRKKALPETQPSDEVIRINNYLQEVMTNYQIPGLTVAVTKNDTVIYTGAFGVRNIETQEEMKPEYIFHWASVSKTFVGTAIMQLAEKGKIDLDEKLVAYLPYFKQQNTYYQDITIRQMLNHTSGIGDVTDYEWDHPQYDEGAPERYVRSLQNDRMLFKPGTGWSYSNTAFNIIGVVIAEVSGMPFETFIRQNILDPLEMNQTSFLYPEIPDTLRVAGHLSGTTPIVSKIYPYNRIHAPSSTLNSNVVEITHYAMANLNRGKYKNVRILSDASYDVLWTNSVQIDGKPMVGVSWFLDEYQGLMKAAHGGGDTGFRSFLLLVPEKKISVMVVCNYELRTIGTIDIADDILDILLN